MSEKPPLTLSLSPTKLKPPEESYHALIQLGSDIGQAVVMLRDIDGIEGMQVFASDIWFDVTGYTREELLGISFFNLVKTNDRQSSLERHRPEDVRQVRHDHYHQDQGGQNFEGRKILRVR